MEIVAIMCIVGAACIAVALIIWLATALEI